MDLIHNILIFPGGSEIGLEILKSLSPIKGINLFSASSNVSNHAPFVFKKHNVIADIYSKNCIKELNKIIEWLTGFNESQLKKMLNEETTFKEFFENAIINPKAHLITGVICGYRIEKIKETFQLYRNCRYLDKLVDELSKGKELDKILRP